MMYTFRVIGAGEIGTRLALAMLQAGHRVTLIDRDEERLREIAEAQASGVSAQLHPFLNRRLVLKSGLDDGSYTASFVCVPSWDDATGVSATNAVDVVHDIVPRLGVHELLAFESTLPIGAVEQTIVPLLESYGRSVGADVFVVSSPERIDTTISGDARAIPKLVGGATPECTLRGTEVYRSFIEQVVPVGRAAVAEAAKLLENAYRFVNIAFINEVSLALSRAGLNPKDVVSAAESKGFGYAPFWPSAGISGHCVPAAGKAMRHFTAGFGIEGGICESAVGVEERRAERILSLIGDVEESEEILLVGAGYKSHTTDTRNSAAFPIAEALAKSGHTITLLDPALRPDGGRRPYRIVDRLDADGRDYACVVLLSWRDAFTTILSQVRARRIIDLSGSSQAPSLNRSADAVLRAVESVA